MHRRSPRSWFYIGITRPQRLTNIGSKTISTLPCHSGCHYETASTDTSQVRFSHSYRSSNSSSLAPAYSSALSPNISVTSTPKNFPRNTISRQGLCQTWSSSGPRLTAPSNSPNSRQGKVARVLWSKIRPQNHAARYG